MISYLERFILEFKLKSVTKKGLEMEEKKKRKHSIFGWIKMRNSWLIIICLQLHMNVTYVVVPLKFIVLLEMMNFSFFLFSCCL